MAANGKLAWLGHATFKLTLPDDRVLFIDPWLAENPACPEPEKRQPRCDLIGLTHAHADHAGDAPALIRAYKPKVVATFELCALLDAEVSGSQCQPMNIGGTQEVDRVRFSLTPAWHSSAYQTDQGLRYAGMPAGLVIQVDGLATFYHPGDTDVFSDMKLINERYQPKIIALPVGDLFTMGPAAAAMAAQYFNPAAIIPMHYGTFPILTGTVDAFKEALPAPLRERVVTTSPGQTLTWTPEGLTR